MQRSRNPVTFPELLPFISEVYCLSGVTVYIEIKCAKGLWLTNEIHNEAIMLLQSQGSRCKLLVISFVMKFKRPESRTLNRNQVCKAVVVSKLMIHSDAVKPSLLIVQSRDSYSPNTPTTLFAFVLHMQRRNVPCHILQNVNVSIGRR